MKGHKPLGSEAFNTANVRTDEYILLAECMVENGSTPMTAALKINYIDDMLSALKIKCLAGAMKYTSAGHLRKNIGFRSILNRNLDILVKDIQEAKGE
jgi:hypothetical protein